MLMPTAAWAQDLGSCVQASPEFAKKLAEARKGQDCQVKCEGCGCKGGPGYRSLRTMQCVGYKNLVAECGPPPHERCQRECTPVVAGCERPTGPQPATQ